ncbi:Transposase [Streptococcus parauberis KRS-02109]|nr:Transposase [Streptococcus parauberis KRS-02109]
MSKRSPKSAEEKLEAVQLLLNHEKSPSQLSKLYGVSEPTIKSWVRKFEKNGSQGLVDRRGKGLESRPDLTETEQLQLKIKQLEERNHLLEIEVGLLKRLEDIKRGKRR